MQRAIVLVVLADLWWGISAIYWNALASVSPVEDVSPRARGPGYRLAGDSDG